MLGGSGVLALRKRDFLLAGYYRSGTTWIRLVLCNLISLNEWNGRDVDPILNDVMPELGVNNLFKRWSHPTVPRVIKTHRPYSPLLGKIPSIGLIRDPRDVMVSRYHRRRDWWADFDATFSEFIRHPRYGLEDWFRHYASWRGHWILTLTYEDLLEDAPREFTRILDTLRVSCPDGTLDEAIARSSFRSMQLVEKERRPAVLGDALHFRSGSSGQWGAYFGEEDVAYYLDLVAKHDVRVYR